MEFAMLRAVADPPTVSTEMCNMPGCEAPAKPRKPGPGAPPAYCEDRLHNAVNALRAKRKLAEREARQASVVERQAPSEYPVTEGVAALPGHIARLRELGDEFAAGMADIRAIVNEISDPHAIAHEVVAVRAECDQRIAESAVTTVAAENVMRTAIRQRDKAITDTSIAEEAAGAAIQLADDAEERARRAAEDAVREVAAAHAAARQVAEDADRRIAAMAAQLDAERDARVRAETERETARLASEELRVEAVALRGRIDALHTSHAAELSEAHRVAEAGAREVREQHASELAAVREEHAATVVAMRQEHDGTRNAWRDELADVRRELADSRRELAAAQRPPTGRPRTTSPGKS